MSEQIMKSLPVIDPELIELLGKEDRPFYISHGDAVKELNKTRAALALTEKRLQVALEGLEESQRLCNRSDGLICDCSANIHRRKIAAITTATIAKVKEIK